MDRPAASADVLSLTAAAALFSVVGVACLISCGGGPPELPFVLAAGFFGWRPKGSEDAPPGSTPDSQAVNGAPQSFAEIVHALDIAAILLDAERRIVEFNRHAADLFPSISVGAPVALASRNPDLTLSIDRVFAAGRTETAEFTERMLQGRRFIVTSTLLSGPQLLLQFRDTSEQERLAQLRADFIANASHELRTPLASIKGFIETLQGPARDDEKARSRFLEIMGSQAQRMNRILDDLLSLSRIEMRAHLKPEGSVDIDDLVAHVIRGLEPLASQAAITLSFKPGEAQWPVRGDRDELEQVMQNLIHNALKYGRAGGRVDVDVSLRPAVKGGRPKIAVAISDDGPGIAPEHLPRLTERFYRVDAARSREKGGTGLGLAIVKHILNRHRGELEISSELGRGSRFTVVLEAAA